MASFYECTRCQAPFLANDQLLIARREGICRECAKRDALQSFGLPPDFLDTFPWRERFG